MNIKQKVIELFEIQNLRMLEYEKLNTAFENYLRIGPSRSNEIDYNESLTNATTIFKNVSERATNIKQWLSSQSSSISFLASHIENIQSLEKKRLELTISYQLTKGYAVDHISETGPLIHPENSSVENGNGDIAANGIANLTISDMQDENLVKDQAKIADLKAEIDDTLGKILDAVQALREDAEDYLLYE